VTLQLVIIFIINRIRRKLVIVVKSSKVHEKKTRCIVTISPLATDTDDLLESRLLKRKAAMMTMTITVMSHGRRCYLTMS